MYVSCEEIIGSIKSAFDPNIIRAVNSHWLVSWEYHANAMQES